MEMEVPQYGEMFINVFFKKNTDVGAVADTFVDMVPGFTAFNHAEGYKAANGNELHVAKHKDLDLYTDFKTFITVSPLSHQGEFLGMAVIQTCAETGDMTHVDAHPMVVKS